MNKKPGRFVPLGPLSPSKPDSAQHYVLPPQNFDTPSKHCGSLMPNAKPGEITKHTTPNYRTGSLQFMECKSVGTGC